MNSWQDGRDRRRGQETGDRRLVRKTERQEEAGVSGNQVGGDQENRGPGDLLLMIDYSLPTRGRVGILDGCFDCFFPPCSAFCSLTDAILLR